MSSDLARDLLGKPKTWFWKDPVRNAHGGYSAYINWSESGVEPILFQTTAVSGETKCVAPFGVSEPHENATDKTRLNFELSALSEPLIQFLDEINAMMVETASKKSVKWFKKLLTPDQIQTIVKPVLGEAEYPKDDQKNPILSAEPYPRRFRTKVNTEGENPTKFFMAHKKPGVVDPVTGEQAYSFKPFKANQALETIQEYSKIVAICKIDGVWFMSKEFGLGITALQVLVYPPERVVNAAFNFGDSAMEIDESVEDPVESTETESQAAGSADGSSGVVVPLFAGDLNPGDYASEPPVSASRPLEETAPDGEFAVV